MTRWRFGLLLALTLSAIYLYAFPTATVIYGGGVLLHAGAGIVLAILLFPILRDVFREIFSRNSLCLAARRCRNAAWPRAAENRYCQPVSFLALPAHCALRRWRFAPRQVLARQKAMARSRFCRDTHSFVVAAIVLAGVGAGSWWTRNIVWKNSYRVENPKMTSETMDGEGAGPNGQFFPSSAQTTDGKDIPAKYFMQSQACERCHQDIYNQWNSSAHHFSSFNNQWYRKSIEYMQDVAGTKPSKWCARMPRSALLFSGMMDTPDQADRAHVLRRRPDWAA